MSYGPIWWMRCWTSRPLRHNRPQDKNYRAKWLQGFNGDTIKRKLLCPASQRVRRGNEMKKTKKKSLARRSISCEIASIEPLKGQYRKRSARVSRARISEVQV